MVVFAVYLNTRGFLFLVINMSTPDFSVMCIADISRHATWPGLSQKCNGKPNGLLYGGTRLSVVKGGFIWNQTKAMSINNSFSGRLIGCFECFHLSNINWAVAAQFYRESLLRADQLYRNRLNYPVNRETCSVHNLLHCLTSVIIIYLSFLPLITERIASLTEDVGSGCRISLNSHFRPVVSGIWTCSTSSANDQRWTTSGLQKNVSAPFLRPRAFSIVPTNRVPC